LVSLRTLRALRARNALIAFGSLSPGWPWVSLWPLRALRARNPLVAL